MNCLWTIKSTLHRHCSDRLLEIVNQPVTHIFDSDKSNSLLVGLPKVRLLPIQSVLNAAARLIAQLPRTFHISAFMFDHLHWLPLIAWILLKVLTLIYRSLICQAPRCLHDLVRLPSFAISLCPLRSLDRHDLFVPQVRTFMAQTRAFAIIGPLLWNQLLPSTQSTLLTGEREIRLFNDTSISKMICVNDFNRWSKCLFFFSQDFSLLSGSFTLEALLIGMHCKKRHINVWYNTIQVSDLYVHLTSGQTLHCTPTLHTKNCKGSTNKLNKRCTCIY